MNITPYLNMTGNAEEALNFYKSIFGGEVEILRWGEIPPDEKMPISDEWKNKIMHSSLTIRENLAIFLSDSLMDNQKEINNSVFLHVEFDSESEVRKAYEALSRGGQINMPLDNTFWGAIYGDLKDKYGIGWGLQYQLPE